MKQMNTIYITIAFCMISILGTVGVSAQENSDSVSLYLPGDPLECIYFVTDRDLYLTGEPIWFSAQCLLKESKQPSPLSRVLYIELFNAEKKSFKRDKFTIHSGKVSGSIQIPEELPSGNYFLRAYTQYLRNFQAGSFYTLFITVINPALPLALPTQLKNDSIRIVPDGTALVSGLPSRVAIRIPDYMLKKAKAFSVVDHNQQVIGVIEPFKNGLAMFNLTPADSTTYFLKTDYGDGQPTLFEFPAASTEGYSLQAELSGSEMVCHISCTIGIQNGSDPLRLLLISEESGVSFEKEIRQIINGQTIKIPFQNFKEGANYLVLSDHENNVMQYISYYRKPEQAVEIPVQLEKYDFSPREPVVFEMSGPLEELTDTAVISVSVVVHGTSTEVSDILQVNIVENYNLFNPNYFIGNDYNISIQKQLETALVLNKKRANYDITNLKNKDIPLVYLPEIRDVTVSGYVREKESGAPVPGVQVFASVLFNDLQVHSTITNKDGSFVFALNQLEGNHDLYLYALQNNKKELELLVNSDFHSDFPDLTEGFQPPDTASKQLIEELWINQQVSQSFSADSTIPAKREDNQPFLFGEEMTTYKLSDYIELNTMKEVFNEIIPFVRLTEAKGQYRFSVYDKKTEILFRDPLLLLDHIPLNDPGEINKIHPSQVESIGVITGVYVLGNHAFQGVISILTKSGNFGGIRFPNGAAFLEFQALSPASTLTTPEYNPDQHIDKHQPDFRTLLYWNPEVKLTSSKLSLKFYTSDHCSLYDIIVKGYTKSGKLCYGKKTFRVSKLK